MIVSWAPRGHVFAVTDRLGSDSATTFVRSAERPSSENVCAAPQRRLGIRWEGAHHRYCEQAGWTSRGKLVLRLWGYGDGVSFDERLWMKWPWWRHVRGPLQIEGRRLDGEPAALNVCVPNGLYGYGDTGFIPSALIFPSPGCWEVTGRVDKASLTFVILVEKTAEGPGSQCRKLFPPNCFGR